MSFVIRFVVITTLSIFLGYFYYPFLDSDNLQNITSVLINVSAAIFAVAGLWISQIYPEAIKAFSLPNISLVEASEKAKRIESLILVIATSGLVIFILLIVQFLFPLEVIVKGTSNENYVSWFKAAMLLFLSIIQLVSLSKLTYVMFIFANQLHRKIRESKAQRKLR